MFTHYEICNDFQQFVANIETFSVFSWKTKVDTLWVKWYEWYCWCRWGFSVTILLLLLLFVNEGNRRLAWIRGKRMRIFSRTKMKNKCCPLPTKQRCNTKSKNIAPFSAEIKCNMIRKYCTVNGPVKETRMIHQMNKAAPFN